MSAPAGQALLTAADLNLQVNHEARIADLRLAEALGFSDQHKIRPLIARHRTALERFGKVSATVAETSAKGGRPGKSFWLNKRQCLFICTKAETANATEATIQMVEVFDEHLKGILAKPVRVRNHRRALPSRHAGYEPGKFAPGSDILRDLHSLVQSANYRRSRGDAPDDFGAAIEMVLDDLMALRDDPAYVTRGATFDWNHPRASQALAAKLRTRGVDTKPLVRSTADERVRH